MTDACERALTRKDLFDMNCYSVPTQFVQSLPTTSCSKVTQASSVCRNAFEKEKKYKGKDIANASASAKSKGQSPVSRPGSHKPGRVLLRSEYFSVPHIAKPGETISSTEYTVRAGGKGASQAYAIARADMHVDLHGAVGKDGVWVKEFLQKGGVGVDHIRVVEEEVTGRAIIQRSNKGEKSIVLHKGANFNIPPTDAVPDLTGYTHILLQNEIPLESTVNHLLAASEKKITSYFNASPMLSPDQIREFPWKALSWLIVNEAELWTLLKAFKITIPDLTLSTRDNARKGIMALHKCAAFHQGVSIICTLGELGVLYFRSGGEVQYLDSAEPRNPVKDTTGVGDCFTGNFVARMALGHAYT